MRARASGAIACGGAAGAYARFRCATHPPKSHHPVYERSKAPAGLVGAVVAFISLQSEEAPGERGRSRASVAGAQSTQSLE